MYITHKAQNLNQVSLQINERKTFYTDINKQCFINTPHRVHCLNATKKLLIGDI